MTKRTDGEGSTGVKPDGRYYYAAMVDGKRIWGYGRDTEKPRKLKDGPKNAKADFEVKAAAWRRRQPVVDPHRTLGEWTLEWFNLLKNDDNLEETTIARDLSVLKNHVVAHEIGTTRLSDLTPPMMVRWRDDRSLVLKPGSLLKVVQALNKVLKSAIERGLLNANPLDGMKRPSVKAGKIKTLTLEEQKILLDHIKGETRVTEDRHEWRTCDPGREGAERHGDHWRVRTFVNGYTYKARRSSVYPLLVAITYTGMRKGEAVALKWSHVNLDTGMIRVEKTEDRYGRRDTKTEAGQRWLPAGPGLVALLKEQKRQQARDADKIGLGAWTNSGYVFTTSVGTRLSGDAVLRAVKKAAVAVGMVDKDVKVNVHALRHAYGTNLLLQGVDPTTIKELLGHEDLRTTDRYMHPTPEHLRGAVDAFDERLRLLG